MREIYYTLFLNLNYEAILFTAISECVLKGCGYFTNNNLKIKTSYNVIKYEKQILQKIKLNKKSSFHFSDYHKWIDYLINDCFKNKLLKYNLFLKIKPTNKFKKLIKYNKENIFNNYIIKYIDTLDINVLIKVIPEIKNIVLPQYIKKEIKIKKYPFNIDELDMTYEAVGNQYGCFKTERWKLIKK